MSDEQIESQDSRELESVFRQTILWRFDFHGHADVLRQFGHLLFILANEAHFWGGPGAGKPLVEGELEAASDDLDYLVTHLETVVRTPSESVVDEETRRLCQRAEGWSARIASLAAEIRWAVDPDAAAEEDPVERLRRAARGVLLEERGRRNLRPGSDPLVDELEEALEELGKGS